MSFPYRCRFDFIPISKLLIFVSFKNKINPIFQATLDETTIPWGVKVERVEMKDVRLPYQLQRVMAAEAEATRDAMAKVGGMRF